MPPKFELKTIKAIETKLNTLPPAQKLSRAEALAELSGAISGLLNKGYDFQQIAQHLTDAGLPVNAKVVKQTLNSLPESVEPVDMSEMAKIQGDSQTIHLLTATN